MDFIPTHELHCGTLACLAAEADTACVEAEAAVAVVAAAAAYPASDAAAAMSSANCERCCYQMPAQ